MSEKHPDDSIHILLVASRREVEIISRFVATVSYEIDCELLKDYNEEEERVVLDFLAAIKAAARL